MQLIPEISRDMKKFSYSSALCPIGKKSSRPIVQCDVVYQPLPSSYFFISGGDEKKAHKSVWPLLYERDPTNRALVHYRIITCVCVSKELYRKATWRHRMENRRDWLIIVRASVRPLREMTHRLFICWKYSTTLNQKKQRRTLWNGKYASCR